MVSIQKSLKPQFLREEKKKSELYEHLHMCELKAHAMQLQNPTLIKKNKNYHAGTSLPINSLLESLLQVGAKFRRNSGWKTVHTVRRSEP